MSQTDLWRFLQETQTFIFQVEGCLKARIITLSEGYSELLTHVHSAYSFVWGGIYSQEPAKSNLKSNFTYHEVCSFSLGSCLPKVLKKHLLSLKRFRNVDVQFKVGTQG